MKTKKRLIDADSLLHDNVWLCGGFVGDPYSDGYMDALDKAETVIREFPTVDAVEVVRCKDCKHYRNHPNGLCFLWTEPYDNAKGYKGDEHCVEPDDYCSYGERKING